MAQPETLSLAGRRVAFTTPQTTGGGGYGGRLHELLRQRGAQPLPVPTIAIRAHEPDRLRPLLLPGALDPFAALAFTSRSGIAAFSRALPPSSSSSPPSQRPISDAASALPFTIAALGSDADLLDGSFLSRLCRDAGKVTVLVPDVPTPAGLVEALGRGSGRRVLCPVPDVDGLREPPVVPDFLAGLEAAGWVAVRAPAYTTCWAGPGCAEVLVAPDATAPDAIVFTSSAEVEGLLKGLDSMGWSWPLLRARWPDMVVAAHGPVTTEGVRRLGIEVDVVSSRFSSFHGVLDALAATFPEKIVPGLVQLHVDTIGESLINYRRKCIALLLLNLKMISQRLVLVSHKLMECAKELTQQSTNSLLFRTNLSPRYLENAL